MGTTFKSDKTPQKCRGYLDKVILRQTPIAGSPIAEGLESPSSFKYLFCLQRAPRSLVAAESDISHSQGGVAFLEDAASLLLPSKLIFSSLFSYQNSYPLR